VDEIFGDIISVYPLDQAIEDGVLVEVFKNMWDVISHGKPVVVTRRLYEDANQHLLFGVVNQFDRWKRFVMPTLPEEDQMFVTSIQGKNVWVIEDGSAITVMYPEDY
jgi:hypothetical protein